MPRDAIREQLSRLILLETAAELGCKFEVIQRPDSDFVTVRLRNESKKFIRSVMLNAKGYETKVYPAKVELLTNFKTAQRGRPAFPSLQGMRMQ